MVLHRNFTVRICTGLTEVRYSPPIILRFPLKIFKNLFYNREACVPAYDLAIHVRFQPDIYDFLLSIILDTETVLATEEHHHFSTKSH